MKIKVSKVFVLAAGLLIVSVLSGCGVVDGIFDNVSSLVGLNETGTVIAKTAQVRSSYAVVAADLLEVKRGETLDIWTKPILKKCIGIGCALRMITKPKVGLKRRILLPAIYSTNRKTCRRR